MGSVKDLVRDDSVYGRLYSAPTATDFGRGVWRVKGTFSVKDLKSEIPETDIKYKPEALTMVAAAFFEYLGNTEPWINTCYLGVVDMEGKIVSVGTLLQRGETTNHIAMRLAHTPDSFSNGCLETYRKAMQSGELQCGVADVESIFRKGFPLGSSTFKRIFAAVDMSKDYESLATYEQVFQGLKEVRARVARDGLPIYPKLETILMESNLEKVIPNPGFLLKDPIYDSTTKFESAGDRIITKQEEKKLSGLSNEGYVFWVNEVFPKSVKAQIKFAKSRNLLNIDGKEESVSYRGKPWITDFAMTPDENRLMIVIKREGINWAIPSNKEIQRAKFTEARVDTAISEAKKRAIANQGNADSWRDYFGDIANGMNINIREVAEHSCQLMSYAVSEVGNRVLGKRVFDVPHLDTWVDYFMPYASKLEHQLP